MMRRLKLYLQGPLIETLDAEPLMGLRSNRTRALLAYLALEAGQAHPRERLAALLWGEYPTRSAMLSLRVSLSNLRKVLDPILWQSGDEPLLTITRRQVLFRKPHPGCWVDAVEFDALCAATFRHPHRHMSHCAACAQRLEQAMALYRGDLLDGLVVPGSPAFDEWRLLEQETRHRQALGALEILVGYHLSLGHHDRARDYVQRQIELEPWRENAHRDLMRLLVQEGQPSAALGQFESLKRLLADELGVGPAPETVALAESIRPSAIPWTMRGGEPRPAALGTGGPTRFVGRARELAWLGAHLDAALEGEGRVAFVTGDAGSGKTTLLAEFGRRAMDAEAGVLAVAGLCEAHTNLGEPFLPFLQVLRTLAGEVQPGAALGILRPVQERRLQELWPAWIPTLLNEAPALIDRWIPASLLRARCADLRSEGQQQRMRLDALSRRESGSEAAGAQSRTALFDQITQAVESASRSKALILILDDLHWIDGDSLDLLYHLGAHLEGSRILVLGAYRETPVMLAREGAPHPLQGLLHEFQRRFGNVILGLEPEGRKFVDAYLDSEPNLLGEAFREMLTHRTAGHPLLTVELVRSLQERGGLVRGEYGLWVEGATVEWDRLPSRVEAVIARRVARLPLEWQALLSAASVQGEAFEAEVAARVQAVPAREAVRILSGPLSQVHRLVQAEKLGRFGPHTLSRYRFRHNLVQAYLYQRLDRIERAFLHEATGEALEDLVQETQDRQPPLEAGPAVLARHFLEAGLPDKAIHYLCEASKQAVLMSANQDSVAHLERALELLQGHEESPDRDQQELTIRLALYAPLVALRGHGSSEVGRSLARVRELCSRVPEAPMVLTAHMAVAAHRVLRADFAGAVREAERALARAKQQDTEGHAVWARQAIGYSRLCEGDLGVARRFLDEARQSDWSDYQTMLGVRGTDPRVVSLMWSAWTHWLQGYPDQSKTEAQQALDLADALHHAHTRAIALQIAGAMLHQMRREPEMLSDWLDELSSLAYRFDLAHLRAEGIIYQGWISSGNGAGPAAVEAMRGGYAARLATGARALGTVLLAAIADGCLRTGDLVAAQQALDEGFDEVRETGERVVEAELWRLQGEVLLQSAEAAGREAAADAQVKPNIEQAASCFQRAIRIARDQGARSWELRASISLSRLWHRQRRSEEARTLLHEAYGGFTEGFDSPDLLEARTLLKRLRSV